MSAQTRPSASRGKTSKALSSLWAPRLAQRRPSSTSRRHSGDRGVPALVTTAPSARTFPAMISA